MVSYECLRCGYSTNLKTNMIRHLKRKKVCPATYLDVERSVIIDELKTKTASQAPKTPLRHPNVIQMSSSVIQMSSKCHPKMEKNVEHFYDSQQKSTQMLDGNNIVKALKKHSKNSQKNDKKTNKNEKTNKNYSIFHCRYCNKPFRYRQGKHKHEKNRCKIKQEMDDIHFLKNEVIELKKKWENGAPQTIHNHINHINHINNIDNSHTTNKNINSFNTVNVHLNTVGNENIEYLKSFIMKNIGDIIQCKTDFFIEYIKQKHFHPEHIENHNIVSFNHRADSMYAYTKEDTHLERRLKNSISLILYKNIIDDVSIFLDTQLQKTKSQSKRLVKYNRASKRMDTQLDAISDYERKDIKDTYNEGEKKSNIKMVNTHLKEIENTIYNQSKTTYGDMLSYYDKHKD